MIHELTQDFFAARMAMPPGHRKLRTLWLLEVAIRRDIPFLDRRPTTLFQCLWNSCWWHDAPPDRAFDIVAEPQVPGASTRPVERGPKLHEFLERVRAERELAFPGFAWIRSLRPPSHPLDSHLYGVLRGHTASITGVAFSSDSQRIATASWDGTARVWDLSSGREVLCTENFGVFVNAIAFSPDNERIMLGLHDGRLVLCEVRDGSPLFSVPQSDLSVTAVAFSPDGERVLSAQVGGKDFDHDWSVTERDARDGALLWSTAEHDSWAHLPTSVVYSPDAKVIATSFENNNKSECEVRLWDSRSRSEVARLHGHEGDIYSVAFRPDGKRVVTASEDRTLRIWDVARGAELHRIDVPQAQWLPIRAIWSPDGRYLISASFDKTVRVWDAKRLSQVLVLRGHKGAVQTVAISPDSRWIVTGAFQENVAIVWDLKTRSGPPQVYDRTVRAEFTRDGRLLVSSSRTSLTLRAAADGRVVGVCSLPDRAVFGAVSADGTLIAAMDRALIRILSMPDGSQRWQLAGHDVGHASVAFSADGRLLAAGATLFVDASVQPAHCPVLVWDLETGRRVAELGGHRYWVESVTFSRDNRMVAAGCHDDSIRVWDLRGQQLHCLTGHHSCTRAQTVYGGVHAVAFSVDSKRIVSASRAEARVWDLARGKCLEVLTGVWDPSAIAEGVSRFRLQAGSREGQVIIEDVPTRTAVGWFPAEMARIETHANGQTWLGTSDWGPLLLRLEPAAL